MVYLPTLKDDMENSIAEAVKAAQSFSRLFVSLDIQANASGGLVFWVGFGGPFISSQFRCSPGCLGFVSISQSAMEHFG